MELQNWQPAPPIFTCQVIWLPMLRRRQLRSAIRLQSLNHRQSISWKRSGSNNKYVAESAAARTNMKASAQNGGLEKNMEARKKIKKILSHCDCCWSSQQDKWPGEWHVFHSLWLTGLSGNQREMHWSGFVIDILKKLLHRNIFGLFLLQGTLLMHLAGCCLSGCCWTSAGINGGYVGHTY